MKGYPEEFYKQAQLAVVLVQEEDVLRNAVGLVQIELVKENKIPAVILLKDGIKLDPKVTEGMAKVTVIDYYKPGAALISLVDYLDVRVKNAEDSLTGPQAQQCFADFLIQINAVGLLERLQAKDLLGKLGSL